MKGRDFCIEYYSEEPVVSVNNGVHDFVVFPLVLYNEEWGFGASTGVLTDELATRGRRSYFWAPISGFFDFQEMVFTESG